MKKLCVALLLSIFFGGSVRAESFGGVPEADATLYWTGQYAKLLERYDTRLETLHPNQINLYCITAYTAKYFDKLERCLSVYQRRFGERVRSEILRLRAQYALDVGDYGKAIEEAGQLRSIWLRSAYQVYFGNFWLPANGILSIAHALSGNQSAARQYIKDLENPPRTFLGTLEGNDAERVRQIWLARAYMAVGEYQRAYEITRKDASESQVLAAFIIKHPYVEQLWFSFLRHKSELESSRVGEAKIGLDQMLAMPAARANGDIHWLLLYDRGRIAERESQLVEAAKFYAQAVDVIEAQRSALNTEASKIGFVGSKQNVYRDLIRVLMTLGHVGSAFDYVERSKARALVDMLASKKDFAVSSGNAERVRELLAKAESAEASARTADSGEFAASKRSLVSQARQDLAAAAPELTSLVTVSTLSASAVQQALAADETLVEYFYSDADLYAFVVTRDAISGTRLNAADLDRDVQAFRKAVQTPASQAWKETSTGLYQRLIAPLGERLRTENLTIVPHGSLHYLPFNALNDGTRFLIERHSVRMLPAATVLKFLGAPKTDKPGTLLAFGNPDLGNARYDLAFAQSEAETITKAFPNSRALLRKDASKTAFRKYASDFRMLHVASHGEFDADKPLASSLLLSPDGPDNGRLTVGELYSMRVEADLVTLSACETGLGKVANGDDVVGLTRGFLYAGASTIVSSLWQVEDRSTGDLMTAFYQALAKGSGKRSALRTAQIDFLKTQPHPFFWAAFQLTGTP